MAADPKPAASPSVPGLQDGPAADLPL